MVEDDDQQTRQYLVARFWEAALGFWQKGGGRTAWLLTLTVIAIAFVNLGLQYRLNVWHRAMFDALDKRDGSEVLYQSMLFFPLIFGSVGVAAAATGKIDAAAQMARMAECARAGSVAYQRPLLSTQPGSGRPQQPGTSRG